MLYVKKLHKFVLFSFTCFVFNFDCGVCQDVLRITPDKIVVGEVGEKKHMTCYYNGTITNVVWKDANQHVIETSTTEKYKLQSFRGRKLKLTFASLTLEDRGTYTCEGQVMNGEVLSEKKQLRVIEQVKIRNKAKIQTQTFVAGENATIVCDAIGSPPPKFEWYRNGKVIQSKDGRLFYEPAKGNLSITSITIADGGKYVCMASQEEEGNEADVEIDVIVEYKPRKVKIVDADDPIMTDDVVVIQDDVDNKTFICSFASKPVADYTWYFSNGSDYKPIKEVNTVLTISHITTKDSGMYKCVASNEHGEAFSKINFTVHVRPEIATTKTTSCVEAGTSTIQCSASGVPPPRVSIYDRQGNRMEIQPAAAEGVSPFVEYDAAGAAGSIRFEQCTPQDAGNYICRAENKAGNASASLQLQVMYAPKPKDPVEFEACMGRTVDLKCEFDARPAADLVWGKVVDDGNSSTFVKINASDNYIITTTANGARVLQVTVTNDKQYGEYVCRASNPHGNASSRHVINEPTVPSAVHNLQVSNINTSSARVHFSAPLDFSYAGIPLVYVVKVAPMVAPMVWEDVALSGGEREHWFRNLQHKTAHTVAVEATKCDNIRSEPTSANFTTDTIGNPEPIDVTSTTVSDEATSYNLTWTYGDLGGGTVRNVTISLAPSTTASPAESVTTPLQRVINLTSEDLNQTDNQYKITAVNVPNGEWIGAGIQGSEVFAVAGQDAELQLHQQPEVDEEEEVRPAHHVVIPPHPPRPLPNTVVVQRPNNSTIHPSLELLLKQLRAIRPDMQPSSKGRQTGMASGVVVSVALAAIIIVLLIVDFTMCMTRHCGLSHMVYTRTCAPGHDQHKRSRDDASDDGENPKGVDYREDENDGNMNENKPLTGEEKARNKERISLAYQQTTPFRPSTTRLVECGSSTDESISQLDHCPSRVHIGRGSSKYARGQQQQQVVQTEDVSISLAPTTEVDDDDNATIDLDSSGTALDSSGTALDTVDSSDYHAPAPVAKKIVTRDFIRRTRMLQMLFKKEEELPTTYEVEEEETVTDASSVPLEEHNHHHPRPGEIGEMRKNFMVKPRQPKPIKKEAKEPLPPTEVHREDEITTAETTELVEKNNGQPQEGIVEQKTQKPDDVIMEEGPARA